MTGRSAIILAGGRSSRMGTPKALLPFGGEPLLVHIVRTLQPDFPEVVVVAAPAQELPSTPARVVRDVVADQGPVAGICYGLHAIDAELAFVTSCDAVFVSTSLVRHLFDRAPGFDVVVPRWDARLQPLFAVYRKSVAPVLEAQLRRGELRLTSVLELVRTLAVDADEIAGFDPDGSSFFTMNTPADYQRALARWVGNSPR